MPSTLAAASAGAVLDGRRRILASTVLDTVIAAVPMTPANRPRPIAVASSLAVMRAPPRARAGTPSLRRPRRGEAGVEGQAAVDEDGLAGDVGRLVGGEEAGDAGHLVGGAGAAQRDVLLDLASLLGGVDPRPGDRRDRRARADAVDADAVGRVLQGERLRQVLHPALAHAVAEVVGLGDDLVDARDVDDRAAGALVKKAADRLARAHERAAQVDVDDAVEVA